MMENLIRPELLVITPEQWLALKPFLTVFLGSLVMVVLAVVKRFSARWLVLFTGLMTCVLGILFSVAHTPESPVLLFNGMMVWDSFSSLFNIIFMVSAIATLLTATKYLDRENLQHPEFNVLVVLSALGMMLLAASLDLIVVFISLEIMSLSVYTLVGFRRADRKSNEAAIKYFILGSAAAAIYLYGTALVYGATGSLNMKEILQITQANPAVMTPVFVMGAALMLIGFLFKVASVPFHMWMPDVYEGAPVPVTGFMTTGLKAASFAALLRIFIFLGYGKTLATAIEHHIHDLVWVLAVLTMIIGNVVGLTQTSLKRMLAYSSIAHTGYLLIGLLAGPSTDPGYSSLVLYLVAYSIMNLGAFAVLSLLARNRDSGLNLQDMSGLSQTHPGLAFALSVFLLSMAGIPPTGGFVAKYYIFYSAVQAGEIPLVIIGVLCSAISVYYYLRVLVFMYMRDPAGEPVKSGSGAWITATVVALLVALTLQVGLLPEKVIQAAKKAVISL